MKTILLLSILALTGCASTTLYNQHGQRIAAFQGDMNGAEYTMAADGSVRWKSATVDHSAATIAQGKAVSGGIAAGGSAMTSLTYLLK